MKRPGEFALCEKCPYQDSFGCNRQKKPVWVWGWCSEHPRDEILKAICNESFEDGIEWACENDEPGEREPVRDEAYD